MKANWFSAAWTAHLETYMANHKVVFNTPVAASWLPSETIGNFWCETYAYMHLYAWGKVPTSTFIYEKLQILILRKTKCLPKISQTEEKALLPVAFPSFLVGKMHELRHRRALDKMQSCNIQISPRLFLHDERIRNDYGRLPLFFRLPDTWTLKITVPEPFTYTLREVVIENAYSIYNRVQKRVFFDIGTFLNTHTNQTLWGAHATNTWNEERIQYTVTTDNRLEPWNRKPLLDSDSGQNSTSDSEFPVFQT